MTKNLLPRLLALGALALAGLTLAQSASAQQGVTLREGYVAVVDDKIITTYDVRQRVIWLLLNLGLQPTEENVAQLQREALQGLIDERLEEQELKRQEDLRKMPDGNLFAKEDEIDDYLTSMARQNDMTRQEFMSELNARGLTTKSIRDQMRILISWEQWTRRFYGRLIRVAPDRVEATLRDITASASEPSYLISEIFISNDRAGNAAAAMQTATQVLAQLQQQGRFEPLARQYSALPTASRGGDAGWLLSGQVRPELLPAVQQLRPGLVSRPIQTSDGVYIVLLREKRDGGGSVVVSLKQIAAPLAPSADDATAQAARNKLLAAKAQLTGCGNVEQVAQAAGLQSGDLGQANLADLSPVFQSAVADLQPNQVSDPVRSDAGLHIVALCSKSQTGGAQLPTVEQVRNSLYEEEIAMIQRRELRNLRAAAIITQPQAR